MLVLVRASGVVRARQDGAVVGMGNLARLWNDVDELAVVGAGGMVDARRVRDFQEGRREKGQCQERRCAPPERER
jgi:hypothetical protein